MRAQYTKAVKELMHDVIDEMHTAIPGRIISFDPDRCEADVLPFGRIETHDGRVITYPLLSKVPVMFPQGGGAVIAFPVKNGDDCLLLFAEQTLETWRVGAATKTELHFDLNNAVALVGLSKTPRAAVRDAVDKDAVIIDHAGTRIELNANGVKIVGDLTVTGEINGGA